MIKVGRTFAAAVISLFIQMQVAENGYASRRTKIAFTSTHGGEEIYVMDGDGSNQRRVTTHPARDRLPTWSPDGKKIAFVSNRNNANKDHQQIWVIDADGKNPIRLTDGLVDTYPDWSPDGTKIVYDAHPAGITVGCGREGQETLRVAYIRRSPDGKRIAFISTVGVINHVFVMDAEEIRPS